MEDNKKKIEEARAKLHEKYASVRTGGPGSQRRKHKVAHKTNVSDAKLDGVMKKFNTQPIPDIAEVNMFTKDNKVICFKQPQGNRSLTKSMLLSKPKLWLWAETLLPKVVLLLTLELKSCFAELMAQLGPRQLEALKNLGVAQADKKTVDKTSVNFQQVSEKK